MQESRPASHAVGVIGLIEKRAVQFGAPVSETDSGIRADAVNFPEIFGRCAPTRNDPGVKLFPRSLQS